MPAFVKSRLGEFGRSEPEGTMVCCFSRKKSRKDCRISAEVMGCPDYNANLQPPACAELPAAQRRFPSTRASSRERAVYPASECLSVFLPGMIRVTIQRPPDQTSRAPPVIQHDTL